LWAAVSGPLVILVGFRTSQAWGRFWEGTSLLHAMRGEWFDSASCLVTFTFSAKDKKPEEVRDFRHTLVRLMSLCHGSALDELKLDQSECYEVLDIRGLDDETLSMLTHAKDSGFNRVEVLLHLIQVLVINAQKGSVIDVPPPILSRVYQTLSRGFVNLLNAKKIKDTRFPFPHAQAIALMILILSVLTPLVVTSLMQEAILAMAATFVPILGLCILNYAAEELEMPFGDDANDLPLSHFQEEMNSSLLMLIHRCSDHVPSLQPQAHRDFESLQASLSDTRNSLNDVLSGKKRGKSLFVAATPIEVEPDQESCHSQFSDLPPSGGGNVGQPEGETTPAGLQTVGPTEAQKPQAPDNLSEAPGSKAASSHKEGSAGRVVLQGEGLQSANPFIKRTQQDEEAQRRVGLQQEEKVSNSSKQGGAGTVSASGRSQQQLTTGDRVNALLQGISPRLGWQHGVNTSSMSPQQQRTQQQQQQPQAGQAVGVPSVSAPKNSPSVWQQRHLERAQKQQQSSTAEQRPNPSSVAPGPQQRGQDVLAGPRHQVGFLTCEV